MIKKTKTNLKIKKVILQNFSINKKALFGKAKCKKIIKN